MTSTEMVRPHVGTMALPTSGDRSLWSDQEAALVEAAGLVRVVNKNTGAKELADRPTVEAFLAHCRRTQLDPIARQIYAIYRAGKWGIQISIDGARLVAERTGQYEGQTTPEFTADGVTWTQVWLSDQQPKAARVGVYRRGFREPLYAIALWGAYAVYQDEWENNRKTGNKVLSAMWVKMGPLMLAKCAEMLALRKAFPQDLSGLYSTEEMDQAGGGVREVVRQVESSHHVPFPEPKNQQERRANAAASAAAGGLSPEAVAAMAAPEEFDTSVGVEHRIESEAIATPKPTRDWAAELEHVDTLEAAAELYREAEAAGELGLVVGLNGDHDDGSAETVMDLFWARRHDLEAQPEPLVDVPAEKPKKRQWVREAKAKDTRDEVRALYMEAQAAAQSADVLEQIAAFEATLPDPDAGIPAEGGGWAAPETEWFEQPDGSWAEQPAAMALDDDEVQP